MIFQNMVLNFLYSFIYVYLLPLCGALYHSCLTVVICEIIYLNNLSLKNVINSISLQIK